MKNIAVIGSSGGNLYNLGGKDPQKLLGEIQLQCRNTQMQLSDIVFIGASASMDSITKDTTAALYTLKGGDIVCGEPGSLEQANAQAAQADAALASRIDAGEIDAIIVMSADPARVNRLSMEAAARAKTPVVGTGGTSMAAIQSMGCTVIAVSGTTGTTNRTRAVAAITAISRHYKLRYTPIIGSTAGGAQVEGSIWKRISFRGIMMASLPGFIAMALILAISKIPGLASLEAVFNLLISGIPVVIAAIAARQVSGLDEVGVVAGVVAGLLSTQGGLIGGLIGGIIAGVLAFYFIRLCLNLRFPATTANIVSGGVSGLIAGLFVYFLIAPAALWVGDNIAKLIQTAIDFSPVLAGVIAGVLIWPAIIGGVYHAAILPIVMLEMSQKGMSFLGAIDMTGLVMVSAGITLANIVYPRQNSDRAIALPGFLINTVFGTFVEAAYPFMFSDKLVFGAALISAAVSGGLVGIFGAEGIAYVPAISAPFMSNNPWGFALSMVTATALAFLLTLLANRIARHKATAQGAGLEA